MAAHLFAGRRGVPEPDGTAALRGAGRMLREMRVIKKGTMARIKRAVFNGEKIAAIKMYRDETGASLADSAEAIDRLMVGTADGLPGPSAKQLAREIVSAGFAAAVAHELRRARAAHAPAGSVEHAYAVIADEVDEFWDEVRRKGKDRDASALLLELVQIGAMAQRMAEDLGLTKAVPSYYAKRS
jgi:ribosomal protein L7/L12